VTESSGKQWFPTPSRDAIAHHEAGHVVAWWALGFEVESAEIDIGAPAFGQVVREKGGIATNMQCAVSEIASWASEARSKGEDPREPSRPDHTYDELKWGLPNPEFSRDEFTQAREMAVEVVTSYASSVNAIAAALLKKGGLTRGELEALRPGRG
jgi:hypothetical protein